MKCKVLALLGTIRPGKKNPAAGMVDACLQYPDGNAGKHVLYNESAAKLASIRAGSEVEVTLRFEEFATVAG